MRTFSPSEVAFEGFRLIGRRPGAVAAWALLELVLAGLVLGLVWLVLGAELPTMLAQISAAKTAVAGGPPDASLAAPLYLKMRAIQWIVNPLALLFSVVFSCAVYRAMTRPSERAFAYLRIGGDELRLFALGVIYFVLFFVAVFGLVILGLILGALIAAVFVAGGQTAQGAGWGGLAALVMCVALICAAIWVCVRLSLAWPISFAEKRIAIFDSWKLTRGNFWRMFGAYLLAAIFVLIFSMAVMMLFGIMILVGAAMLGLHGQAAPDWSRIGPTLAVVGVIWLAGTAALSAATRVVITAPAMAIYRALMGQPTATSVAYYGEDFDLDLDEPMSGALQL